MGIISDMKDDVMGDMVEFALDSPEAQKFLPVANKFIKPAVKNLLKKLGPDDIRFMLYFDNESQHLVLWTIKTANIKEFEVEGVDAKKDIFTLDPEEVKNGNIKDLIQVIMQKLGAQIM